MAPWSRSAVALAVLLRKTLGARGVGSGVSEGGYRGARPSRTVGSSCSSRAPVAVDPDGLHAAWTGSEMHHCFQALLRRSAGAGFPQPRPVRPQTATPEVLQQGGARQGLGGAGAGPCSWRLCFRACSAEFCRRNCMETRTWCGLWGTGAAVSFGGNWGEILAVTSWFAQILARTCGARLIQRQIYCLERVAPMGTDKYGGRFCPRFQVTCVLCH